MNFRLAKISDAGVLADVHLECGKHQVDGFMHKLGKPFLIRYYQVFLAEKQSIIIIAENAVGQTCGFHSGTMAAEEHYSSIRKAKISLALSVIPVLFKNPRILIQMVRRYRSVSNRAGYNYGVKEGPRGEYWAWRPTVKSPSDSLALHKAWHNIMKDLGVQRVRSEVDLSNTRVVRSVKLMGAKFLEETILPDGRKRAICEYQL